MGWEKGQQWAAERWQKTQLEREQAAYRVREYAEAENKMYMTAMMEKRKEREEADRREAIILMNHAHEDALLLDSNIARCLGPLHTTRTRIQL